METITYGQLYEAYQTCLQEYQSKEMATMLDIPEHCLRNVGRRKNNGVQKVLGVYSTKKYGYLLDLAVQVKKYGRAQVMISTYVVGELTVPSHGVRELELPLHGYSPLALEVA